MGDPIKKNSTQKVPFRCPKGEYLDTNDKGEKICLPDEPLGEMGGDGMSCGDAEKGIPCESIGVMGIPDKPVQERSPAPSSQYQFQPAPTVSLQRMIKGNEKVCGVATIRRQVCNTLRSDDCFQDRQEEEICATGQTAKQKLAKLCAGYYKGMGLAVQHYQDCWSYAWLSLSGPEQKK